jgi:hypothetical protein
MSRVSEHLHAMHKFHHEGRGEAIANHTAALEKAMAMEPNGMVTTLLKAEIARHQKAQVYHGEAMTECEKATADHLNKLQPTQISGIVPDVPRPVPRFGQPVPAKPNVPIEFEKVFSIEDDE